MNQQIVSNYLKALSNAQMEKMTKVTNLVKINKKEFANLLFMYEFWTAEGSKIVDQSRIKTKVHFNVALVLTSNMKQEISIIWIISYA